jgi:predicted  nucleic acid-binding Zn-ribbon protein
MRTLDVTGLSDEDLGRLCTLEQLNWSVLNEWVGRCLIGLRSEFLRARHQIGELESQVHKQHQEIRNLEIRAEQQEGEIEDLRDEVVREQSEKAELKAENDDQREELGKLERERNRQEGTITRQALEIDGFRNARKTWEDELKRSTEANEAHKEELAQLKDEIKAMKAKEARLGEEVAQLTNLLKHTVLHPKEANAGEIIKRIFPESKQFPPSVKKGKTKDCQDREVEIDVPDGIIAYLTRKCGGNVHDRHVVEVSSGSFEKEIHGANPYSGAWNNGRYHAAKNATDLEAGSVFFSAYRGKGIPHARKNWVCYDFRERRIVPTHYTIRTNGRYSGSHLKLWLVETSADWESWREVAHEEDNGQLNGEHFTGTFAVAGGGGAASSGS